METDAMPNLYHFVQILRVVRAFAFVDSGNSSASAKKKNLSLLTVLFDAYFR